MKIFTILLGFLFVTGTSITYAQLGGALNKVKGAAKEKVEDKVSATKSDPKGAVSGEPAYNPDSPTYRAFSTAKMSLGIAENNLKDEEWKRNPEGRNRDVEVNLKKVQESFAVLDKDAIESHVWTASFRWLFQIAPQNF